MTNDWAVKAVMEVADELRKKRGEPPLIKRDIANHDSYRDKNDAIKTKAVK